MSTESGDGEPEPVYCETDDRYRASFDRDRVAPSVAVVEAVAAVTDTPPDGLHPPLFDLLDADALDRLFAGHGEASRRFSYVAFNVEGCRVLLFSDDTVEVVPKRQST